VLDEIAKNAMERNDIAVLSSVGISLTE